MRQTFLIKNDKNYIPKEVQMVNDLIKKGESFINENKTLIESKQYTIDTKITSLDKTTQMLQDVILNAQEELINIEDTKEQLINTAQTAIEEIKKIKKGDKGEKGEPGKDGITPDISNLKEEILSEIKLPESKPITGEEVIEKINNLSLEDENKIDWNRIKNVPKTESKMVGSPTVLSNAVDLDSSTRQNNYAIVWDSARSRYTHSSSSGGTVSTIVAGTGISVNSTDPANPIITSTITQYTDEMAQDSIGTILVDSSEIDFTYNDATPSITATLKTSSIDETKLDTSVNASLDLADTAVQPNTSPSFSNVTTTGNIELGHASDTTISRVSAGRIAVEGVNVITTSSTDTLTNKTLLATSNVISESTSTTSSSTPTPTGGSLRNDYQVTALATNATFGAPTGTPANNNSLIIRIKDNGTSRTLAWNAIYRFSTDLPAPSATTISKTMYLGFVYNSADSKWDNIAQLNNI